MSIPGMAGIQCRVCGFFHPAPECQIQTADKNGSNNFIEKVENIDLTFLFSNLKNICYSKIASGNIKNHKKLFSHIIIEITKIIENYEGD